MRIALFATCLADALFPESAKSTVRLLERLGHEVVFPPKQTCCGQMHVNTGYQAEALEETDRRLSGFGEQGIRQARGEQGDSHRVLQPGWAVV